MNRKPEEEQVKKGADFQALVQGPTPACGVPLSSSPTHCGVTAQMRSFNDLRATSAFVLSFPSVTRMLYRVLSAPLNPFNRCREDCIEDNAHRLLKERTCQEGVWRQRKKQRMGRYV
jgi:hypothetical protein